MGDGQIDPISTHVSDGLSRLLYQYRNKPLFVGIMTGLLGNFQSIEDAMNAVPPSRVLAGAYGAQLDAYGTLVNLPRSNNPDATYRRLIAGAIGEQNSDGSMPTILYILSQVFATESLFISDSSSPGNFGDATTPHTSLEIGLGNPNLDPAQFPSAIRSFLKALPAAVSVSSLWTFNNRNAFTMAGPQAFASAGFGDANNPAIGGGLASLVYQAGDVGGLSDALVVSGGGTVGAGTGGAQAGAGSTSSSSSSSTSATPATGGSGTTGTTSGTSTGSSSAGSGSAAAETYLVIYQNSTQNSWSELSYESADYGYEVDTRVVGGNARLAIPGLRPYKAFNYGNLNGASLNINNFLGIMVDLKLDSGTTAHVRIQLDPGNNGSPVIYKEFDVLPGWNSYKFYFTDAGVVATSATSFTNVEITNFVYPNVTTPPIEMNNLQLIINPSPPVATYRLVAKDPNPSATTSGWLHTVGNGFFDASGNPWWQPGLNIPDTRMAGKAREQDGAVPTTTAITLMQNIAWANSQGFTMFRLYLDEESADLALENNPTYLQSIQMVVDYIGSLGCHVMISLGVDYTCFPYPPNSGSGQPTIATLTRWSQIATSFRNSGHVLYGLCNEPQGNDTAASQAAVIAIFNKCIDVIRQVEARDGAPNPHIIVCQGVDHFARHGQYFETYRCTDNYFPITDLTNGVGYLAYELHNYESPNVWAAQPYNDGFPSRQTTFPWILGEFGFDYYSVADGSASYNPPTVNDIPAFVDACEANKVPYCAWILDFRDYPALLVDHDPTGYGAGKPIEWTPTGLAYVNYVRAKRGIGGPVTSLGTLA